MVLVMMQKTQRHGLLMRPSSVLLFHLLDALWTLQTAGSGTDKDRRHVRWTSAVYVMEQRELDHIWLPELID